MKAHLNGLGRVRIRGRWIDMSCEVLLKLFVDRGGGRGEKGCTEVVGDDAAAGWRSIKILAELQHN